MDQAGTGEPLAFEIRDQGVLTKVEKDRITVGLAGARLHSCANPPVRSHGRKRGIERERKLVGSDGSRAVVGIDLGESSIHFDGVEARSALEPHRHRRTPIEGEIRGQLEPRLDNLAQLRKLRGVSLQFELPA